MKKIFFGLALFAATLALCGCPDPNTEEPQVDTPEVTNNLQESQGENELIGTYTDGSVRYEFNANGKVTQSTKTSASSASFRAAETDWVKLATYNYSWNTEKKTVEFQLAELFESGKATDYQSQLEEAQKKYGTVKDALITALESDSLYEAGTAAGEEALHLVQAYISSTATSYVNAQESALVDYLAAKYNSVIKLSYTLSGNTLTLTQKFDDDITDASSRFILSGEPYVVLNDYENLVPFGISNAESKFVGIPTVDAEKKTLTCDLYDGLSDVLTEGTSAVNTIVSKKTEQVQKALSGISEDWKTIAVELALQSTTNNSTTLDKHLEGIFVSSEFSASYSTQAKDDGTTLTLTPSKVPTDLATVISAGNSIELDYKPIITTSALTKE